MIIKKELLFYNYKSIRNIKKSKRYIRTNYQLFGGCLTATECMRVLQLSKSTFYRYLAQIKDEHLIESCSNDSVIEKDTSLAEIREKVKQYHISKNN